MNRPRVLIADDHQILAEGVRGLLESEFEVVGVVADGRELLAAAKKLKPDVIVADVTMPSLNGIEAAAQLRDAEAAQAAALTAKHDASIAALDAHLDAVNTPPAGVTIKGNQGR
jgi:CheY-like chemotaxis protein